MKKFTRGALAVATAGMLAVPLSVISQSRLAASQEATTRPNIVVIVTDDQDIDSMPVMRNLMARPEGSWMNFTNAFVNQAICCPSRASMLTGQFAHTHGAVGNELCDEMNEQNTLPVWLDDAGYETALIGKYLNSPAPDRPPPGWDLFTGLEKKGLEDWLSKRAETFINDTTSPFFMYVAYGAPHKPAKPPLRYEKTNAFVPPDRPSFNEEDFADKPYNQPKLTPTEISAMRKERLNGQRELLAVDDGIQRIINALEENGQLDNTLIIFTSDHGHAWGAHRHYGKTCPYEECIEVPLMVRYPGLSGNQDEARFVSNVDLAWTIADYAGVAPQLPQDGRSFLPLLNGSAVDWTNEVLLERYNPIFFGIRTDAWKYIEHKTGVAAGKEELYDLVNDPDELENLAGKAAYQTVEAQMAQRLQALLDKPPVLPPQVTPTPGPTAVATSTPTVGPSPTATNTPVASATPQTPSGTTALVSLAGNGSVAGIAFSDEDILAYNVAIGQWSMFFDGSSFGLGASDIDAFYDHHGEYLLVSTDAPIKLGGLGTIDDSDIIRFVPTVPGNYTAGQFEKYFDGSAAELTINGEDIDALSMLPDGRLLVSLLGDDGRVVINGGAAIPKDEDIIAFTGQTGAVTSGSWSRYFLGSSIGLTTNAEDINGLSVSPVENRIYFSTLGTFKVLGGLAGGGSDIAVCLAGPGSGGLRTCTANAEIFLRGSQIGLGTQLIDGFQIVEP